MTHESDVSVISQFPEVLQTGKVQVEVGYEFDDSLDVYEIKKGPATRVFEVRSNGTNFNEGTDYDLIEDPNGNYVKIDWGIGGSEPNDGDLFIIDQEYKSIMSRYLESHDVEMEHLSEDTVTVVSRRYLDNATGDDLDRLGAIFGDLGKRQERNDSEYRDYLGGVVDSFNGRGSLTGLKFAIAAAIGVDPSDINIDEDFENLSYTIRIDTSVSTSLITSAVDQLAELADPSGVELSEAIIVLDTGGMTMGGGTAGVISTSTGLGSQTLTLDGNSTLG
jgi:hypothetical protein